jgi:SAM-dependent methyltransferase
MSETAYLHLDEVPGAEQAARRLVPAIVDIVGPVRSVVDVGGGTGAVLKAFTAFGVEKLLLLDVEAVRPELLIHEADFQATNLNATLPNLDRFDLALCLECAEHLNPQQGTALVDCLTASADIVIFSAAVPGQRGKGHINLRPLEYWKSLFERRGFRRRDVIRPRILHDRSIPFWYRQNVFLYCRPSATLAIDASDFLPDDFHLVHRDLIVGYREPGFSVVLKMLWPAFVRGIRNRLK